MIVPRPILAHRLERFLCNSSNHHEYAPFKVCPNRLLVDPEWYSTWLRPEQLELGLPVVQQPVEVPHRNKEELEGDQLALWWRVYYFYNQQWSLPLA